MDSLPKNGAAERTQKQPHPSTTRKEIVVASSITYPRSTTTTTPRLSNGQQRRTITTKQGNNFTINNHTTHTTTTTTLIQLCEEETQMGTTDSPTHHHNKNLPTKRRHDETTVDMNHTSRTVSSPSHTPIVSHSSEPNAKRSRQTVPVETSTPFKSHTIATATTATASTGSSHQNMTTTRNDSSHNNTSSSHVRRNVPSVVSSTSTSATSTRATRSESADSIEDLLSYASARSRLESAAEAEVNQLLSAPTAGERLLARQFQQEWVDKEGNPVGVKVFCSAKFRKECETSRKKAQLAKADQLGLLDPSQPDYPPLDSCDAIHMIEIIKPGLTNRSFGDCSYLSSCSNRSCRSIHYEIDPLDQHKITDRQIRLQPISSHHLTSSSSLTTPTIHRRPAEWINCDIRRFDMSVLGQFGVIMMDPPWNINMNLPYDTMADEEMLNMPIGQLQTQGVCIIWVITRCLDLGRRCLARWGYQEKGELIWLKVDQLHRLKRLGRTGHWLNHTKEHAIIGVKGPKPVDNPHLDCDVIVAPVRETSRKPDEIYGILERLAPNARRLEIFGRQHNTRDGWLTIGNQLDGINVHDSEVQQRLIKRYGSSVLQSSTIVEK